MRAATLLRLVAPLAVFGLLALGTPGQQQSDDLAAAARRAREQQKNAPKPAKVITNDDLPGDSTNAPTATSTVQPTGGEQLVNQAGGEAASPDDDPKTEGYWRKRFAKVRDKLAQSEKELDVLQRELDKADVQYYPDPQKALMQQHSRSDINDHRGKIDAKKKQIDDLKKQLSDMEDDLRKAGGDPGWAR
jgi:hypothetical protein